MVSLPTAFLHNQSSVEPPPHTSLARTSLAARRAKRPPCKEAARSIVRLPAAFVRIQSSAAPPPRVAHPLGGALPWGGWRLPSAVVVVVVWPSAPPPRVAHPRWGALPWGGWRFPAEVVVVVVSKIAQIPRYARVLGCAFKCALARRVTSSSANILPNVCPFRV